MRVVIAAWHLRDFNVGLGRYARELIEGLGRVDHVNDYLVLLPEGGTVFPARPNVRYRTIRVPLFKRRVWEQLTPLFGGRCDILHFPYDSCVAWKRSKFVVTIHDLKPLVVGPKPRGRNLNQFIEQAVVGDRWSMIDHVVTDSRCSQRDIVAHLPVASDRVTVVYPGVDTDRFRPAGGSETGSVGRPYVLCVAGDDPMKNVSTLVDAFAELPAHIRSSHELVLVGDVQKCGEVGERIEANGLGNRAKFTGLVDDETLIHLYQEARLFVFPSRYEGFGLPVLEAMACGCPVVASNASSLPEVVGDAGVLVDPLDATGLTRAMAALLEDQAMRIFFRARGLVQARQFAWDRTAREMVGVYTRVVRN
ncbi:hypothetical protein YTPLAS18_25290 [Nitrospira sp.]|nr:hypothetical protein YTPLAS18_25290 [Nitrospira sp.]